MADRNMGVNAPRQGIQRSLTAPGVEPRQPVALSPIADVFDALLQGMSGVTGQARRAVDERDTRLADEEIRKAFAKVEAGGTVTSADFRNTMRSHEAEETFFYTHMHNKARDFDIEDFLEFKKKNPKLDMVSATRLYTDAMTEGWPLRARQGYRALVAPDIALRIKRDDEREELKQYEDWASGEAQALSYGNGSPAALTIAKTYLDNGIVLFGPGSKYKMSTRDILAKILPQAAKTARERNEPKQVEAIERLAEEYGVPDLVAGMGQRAWRENQERGYLEFNASIPKRIEDGQAPKTVIPEINALLHRKDASDLRDRAEADYRNEASKMFHNRYYGAMDNGAPPEVLAQSITAGENGEFITKYQGHTLRSELLGLDARRASAAIESNAKSTAAAHAIKALADEGVSSSIFIRGWDWKDANGEDKNISGTQLLKEAGEYQYYRIVQQATREKRDPLPDLLSFSANAGYVWPQIQASLETASMAARPEIMPTDTKGWTVPPQLADATRIFAYMRKYPGLVDRYLPGTPDAQKRVFLETVSDAKELFGMTDAQAVATGIRAQQNPSPDTLSIGEVADQIRDQDMDRLNTFWDVRVGQLTNATDLTQRIQAKANLSIRMGRDRKKALEDATSDVVANSVVIDDVVTLYPPGNVALPPPKELHEMLKLAKEDYTKVYGDTYGTTRTIGLRYINEGATVWEFFDGITGTSLGLPLVTLAGLANRLAKERERIRNTPLPIEPGTLPYNPRLQPGG